jgi:hypothetical protein
VLANRRMARIQSGKDKPLTLRRISLSFSRIYDSREQDGFYGLNFVYSVLQSSHVII